MRYYEIWVGSQQYQGQTTLTYSCTEQLRTGQLVKVALRKQSVIGFVGKQLTNKPSYPVKPVDAVLPNILPTASLALHEWLAGYYPGPSGPLTNLFLPSSLLQKPKELSEEKVSSARATDLPPLTAEQKLALAKLSKAPSALLHGETGSGKTRIYLELARAQIKLGRSVIILTPEIGLTPQLALSCVQAFPDLVTVLHSELTVSERRRQWLKLNTLTSPHIVIGPRSALFAPLANIGLIIIDESHERTYKQEQAPYYQTSRVAAQLARLHNAQFVMGSATPLVSDYFIFDQKQLPIVRMTTPAVYKAVEPDVTVADLINRDKKPVSRVLTPELHSAMQTAQNNNQQVLLFLNRRGSARLIICQACGWHANCPVCDIPLTYHHDKHNLQCHTCGYSQDLVIKCPVCSSSDIVYQTPGTKSIEQEAKRLFPTARIRRFDGDNLKSERLVEHYEAVAAGDVDIIIGTQVIGKGLDLPKLGLVGIINADTSLQFPDYSSEEQTYQLLRQVIGRVGRTAEKSSVVIQTYNPDNPLLKQVVQRDWDTFYAHQIEERKQFGFPPFCFMLQLTITRASRSSAQNSAIKLADILRTNHPKVTVRGPTPRMHEKVGGKYQWQIIATAVKRSNLLEVIAGLPSGWHYNIDPVDLL